MSLDLPNSIARYFAADRHRDPQALAACFAPSGTVIDEGNTYTGRAAIAGWLANASRQYEYVVEPFAIDREDGRIIVSSRLVGNFPGSPVDLRYRFALEGDLIAALEIAP